MPQTVARCTRCDGPMFVAASERRFTELACLTCGARRYVEPSSGRPQLTMLPQSVRDLIADELAGLHEDGPSERQERAFKAWQTRRATGKDTWIRRKRA